MDINDFEGFDPLHLSGVAVTLDRWRATKGFPAQIGPTFRYLIRRTPPMSLQVAYCRVMGLIAEQLFEIPSKSSVWCKPHTFQICEV